MRVFFLILIVLAAASSPVKAQDKPFYLMPNNKGDMLVNKTYDPDGNLVNTMTYTIQESYTSSPGAIVRIGFILSGPDGRVADQGKMTASYLDGCFAMNMTRMSLLPDMANHLGADTEAVSDYLDYPDMFNRTVNPDDSPLRMEAGQYTIRLKSNKRKLVSVKKYARDYIGNEIITIPAGTFDTAKINYRLEVYTSHDRKTVTYYCTEWYAYGAGIVRSVIRDKSQKLLNYTVLTELRTAKQQAAL